MTKRRKLGEKGIAREFGEERYSLGCRVAGFGRRGRRSSLEEVGELLQSIYLESLASALHSVVTMTVVSHEKSYATSLG